MIPRSWKLAASWRGSGSFVGARCVGIASFGWKLGRESLGLRFLWWGLGRFGGLLGLLRLGWKNLCPGVRGCWVLVMGGKGLVFCCRCRWCGRVLGLESGRGWARMGLAGCCACFDRVGHRSGSMRSRSDSRIWFGRLMARGCRLPSCRFQVLYLLWHGYLSVSGVVWPL